MASKEELFSKLIEYIEKSKDFVLEQAPDLFKEILKFDLIISYIACLFLLSLISIGIFFSVKFYKQKYERSLDRPDFHLLVWLFTTIICAVGTGLIFANVSDIIQIKIAPKYYLLKKLK